MTDAKYIREGSPGWKRRRNRIETRNRNRAHAARVAAEVRRHEQELTRAAEAIFNAKYATKAYWAHKSETDSDSREQILMGNAVVEGLELREAQQRRSVAQQEKRRIQQKANRLYTRSPKPIHPLIAAVRAEELIAAGWGSFERWNIPLDWRTRQPNHKNRHAAGQKLTPEARNRQNGTRTSRKLA